MGFQRSIEPACVLCTLASCYRPNAVMDARSQPLHGRPTRSFSWGASTVGHPQTPELKPGCAIRADMSLPVRIQVHEHSLLASWQIN